MLPVNNLDQPCNGIKFHATATSRQDGPLVFQIPNHADGALKIYSAAGLDDLRRVAAEEFTATQNTIKAAVEANTTADAADLDRSEALYNFIVAADAQLDEYEAANQATVTAATRELPTRTPKTTATTETVTETATETAATEPEAVTAGVSRVTVTDIATETLEVLTPSQAAAMSYTITAAAETGYAAGATLPDFAAVTAAFQERTRTYGGAVKGRGGDDAMQHNVAKIHRNYEEDLTYRPGMTEERIYELGKHATSEKRLQGGSLLNSVQAGIGWCAPSTIVLTTCSPITATGMWQGPEIGAPRGGIRHNQGLDFSTIFGGGTGYNILTEAQVIADTVKTCVQVPCPSFVDDRLKVAALCITGDLLQNVGYPEFVQTFIEGALDAQAHNINRDVIATIVAGSTAVNLAVAIDPWQSDASVVSQVMAAAEMAVVDIRYRLRLDPNATIEMVFPLWLKAQMRADWLRRNSAVPHDLVDAMIATMFATRGVVAQYVYDWQDAFSGLTTTGPGAATPLLVLPQSPTVNLQFLAYPAGTWLLARQSVIRLDSVYDSTLLATNKVTQLFVEDGYLPMRMCPLSRVYTVNICPNGSTGVQRAVACADVTP